MDVLPKKFNKTPMRTHASSAHHSLEIASHGKVHVLGGSALCEEGEVFIGHLGLGTEWGQPLTVACAVALPPNTGMCVEVAAGSLHSLFLCDGGAVYSCGGGWEGVLGHGDEASLAVPRPLATLASLRVEHVAAGSAHSVALANGRVWTWGWGRFGQLGHGDERKQLAPRMVDDLDGVVQVRVPPVASPP